MDTLRNIMTSIRLLAVSSSVVALGLLSGCASETGSGGEESTGVKQTASSSEAHGVPGAVESDPSVGGTLHILGEGEYTDQCLHDATLFGADPNKCFVAFWNAAADNVAGDYPIYSYFLKHANSPTQPSTITWYGPLYDAVFNDNAFQDFMGKGDNFFCANGVVQELVSQTKELNWDSDDLKKAFGDHSMVHLEATLQAGDRGKKCDQQRHYDYHWELTDEFQGPGVNFDPVQNDLYEITNDDTAQKAKDFIKKFNIDMTAYATVWNNP